MYLSAHTFRLCGKQVLLGSVVALATAASPAQGRFCLGGDLDHLSAAQRAVCSARLAIVRSAALRFGAPEGWHAVMVCGEEGWKAYTAFSSRAATELQRAAVDTDRSANTTYFREGSFASGNLTEASQRIVAHEIAALVLHTDDELTIAARVELWMKALPAVMQAEVTPLRASRE